MVRRVEKRPRKCTPESATPVSPARKQAIALSGHKIAAIFDLAPVDAFRRKLSTLYQPDLARPTKPSWRSAQNTQANERRLKVLLTPSGKWFLRLLFVDGLSDDALSQSGAERTFSPEFPLTCANLVKLLAQAENVVLARGSPHLSTTERGCVERLVETADYFGLIEKISVPGKRCKILRATPRLMDWMIDLGLELQALSLVVQPNEDILRRRDGTDMN